MLKAYPRPQFIRENWINLNGTWDFKFDDENIGRINKWNSSFPADALKITVPYTYETKLSGIADEKLHPVVWYHNQLNINTNDRKWIINFEGADYKTTLFVNGEFAGEHEGAYARFSFDITEYVKDGTNDIVVRCEDSESCTQPRGKQRWKKENFGCWYVQTTGIWKTVWVENVPHTYIEKIKITPDLDKGTVKINGKVVGNENKDASLSIETKINDYVASVSDLKIDAEYFETVLNLNNLDEPWAVQAWTPENPVLYDLYLNLKTSDDEDEVKSYFAMRKIDIHDGKIFLNNRVLYQRLILDQGYWKDSHLTAPSDEALEKDVDLIKAAGYNGLRKHEKVEDDNFFYLCDKKGLLMWCEMPSPYTFNDDAIKRFTKEWMEIVEQHYNHPSVITWTAFNESWGVERIYSEKEQQKFTEGIYHLTKAFDPYRPVIVNDGWEHTVSDILTLHDYEERGERFSERYDNCKEDIIENKKTFNHERFAFAKGYEFKGQPVLISEYGGIAFSSDEGWGYGNQVKDESAFLERFNSITKAIKKLPYGVGFCYTQITDVQQEINGLYTMDREPKVDISKIKEINEG